MAKIAISLLVLVACVHIRALTTQVLPVTLTQEVKDTILRLHNDARQKVGVSPLVWDEELAKVAGTWASLCDFNHQPDNIYNDNLAQGKPKITNYAKLVKYAIEGWIAELQYYLDEQNWDCMYRPWDEGSCGHYTQIAWKNTKRVGCAITHCTNDPWMANFVVCDYDPSGNNEGETPY